MIFLVLFTFIFCDVWNFVYIMYALPSQSTNDIYSEVMHYMNNFTCMTLCALVNYGAMHYPSDEAQVGMAEQQKKTTTTHQQTIKWSEEVTITSGESDSISCW